MTDDPVDWDLAKRIAVRVAGEEPLSRSYVGDSLHNDFSEFTPLAEELVSAQTGLTSAEGAARARVIDREGWIDANIRSFRGYYGLFWHKEQHPLRRVVSLEN